MSRTGRRRRLEQAAEELREKLGRFASRPRFADELDDAFDFYFGHGIGEFDAPVGEAEFQRFMEWFIHDYRLSNGHRLIEVFDLEHGAGLSAEARKLLRDWMDAHLTVLELEAEHEGAWTCVDLLTGRRLAPVFFAGEPPLRWSIVVGRPLPVGKAFEVPAAAARLSPSVKEVLLEHLRGEYRRFRLERRGASVRDFLRENGYCLNDLLTELDEWFAEAKAQDEGAHRLVSARAIYRLREPEKAAAKLLAYEDTTETRPGRLLLRSSSGEKPRTLAEIRLADKRLHVRCGSPERLEEAKRILAERLEGLAQHLLDAYEEHRERRGGDLPEEGAGSGRHAAERRSEQQGESFPLAGERVERWEACDEFVERWLERPHPGLNGQPPKRLASLPLGRLRVAELLKRMEYYERCLPGRRIPRAVCELRRRLGLKDEEGIVLPLDASPRQWNRKAEEAVLDELARVGRKELAPAHLSSAAWIWWNYCSLAFPVIRKPRVWAAALHYCVGFVENWPLRRDELAARYAVSAAAVSQNSWKIVDALSLQPYDERYSVFSPLSGLFRRLGPALADDIKLHDPSLLPSLSKAARLREAVAREALDASPGLRERAYALFSAHVGTGRTAQWEEMFLDWFHYDWRIPVMGGRTFVEVAFLYADLPDEDANELMRWIGRHPSFYVVESVGWRQGSRRWVLSSLMEPKSVEVDWLRLDQPVSPGDVVFARLVPIDEFVISIGPVLVFPARCAELLRRALAEDRAFVERWNGRALTWYEFGALYAERLYALALRGMSELGTGLYED